MKHNTCTLLFFFLYLICKGQAPVVSVHPEGGIHSGKTSSGIPCNPNLFWAIAANGSGTVDQLGISGTTAAIINANVYSVPTEGNLAYCNNLNGGSFSPTFYSTSLSRIPRYFDGTAWVNPPVSSAPDKVYNCGGRGDYLYYILYDSMLISKGITRFNGNTFSTIWSWNNSRRASVGDLAVDNAGNVWFFTGPTGGSPIVSDSLFVVSPTGQLLKQYAITLTTPASYGLLLLNSVLYVAFGPNHPTTPNALVPILLSGNTASAGTPIAMPVPVNAYSDLESCNPGNPLALNESMEAVSLQIYPNPVIDFLYIPVPLANETAFDIQLYDVAGKSVYSFRRQTQSGMNELKLDLRHLSAGSYFLQLHYGDKSYTQKIVKH